MLEICAEFAQNLHILIFSLIFGGDFLEIDAVFYARQFQVEQLRHQRFILQSEQVAFAIEFVNTIALASLILLKLFFKFIKAFEQHFIEYARSCAVSEISVIVATAILIVYVYFVFNFSIKRLHIVNMKMLG